MNAKEKKARDRMRERVELLEAALLRAVRALEMALVEHPPADIDGRIRAARNLVEMRALAEKKS